LDARTGAPAYRHAADHVWQGGVVAEVTLWNRDEEIQKTSVTPDDGWRITRTGTAHGATSVLAKQGELTGAEHGSNRVFL